ncbi:MAG TPA: response regulator transcription factor [Cyclobacteriaceae bacterium]|nr:response regulator transcription factor [Cyclobacteriaceae bacterium]HMV09925.1 response regulator transcription factor [Cyclobacteriaceae bacterium]HMV91097.1 response regulator transcription factor [Cyclobacteriaceae bacterium]HMX01636.1 response regulator transcription factor [Cyclobacteriaceae bacterium]HMX50670.1 response regulator transcription factor [Cyclobacteriaceae bacterium]
MTIQPTILLIEDEFTLGEIVKESLESRQFTVIQCESGRIGLQKFFETKPSLVILDVMLPDADGFELARQIRQTNKEVAILFLTAKSLPQHVVEGFESGGNDYLKKPFSLEELIVRIKVLLSRDRLLIDESELSDVLEIGEYKFFPQRQLLQYQSETKKLSSREAELLKLLYFSRNRVIERKTILLKLWNDDHIFNSRSLDVFITKLRKYLSQDRQVQIINYRGTGYKLVM